MKKYLKLLSDGSVHSYHEDLLIGRDGARFQVIEVEDGVNPQPDHYLSAADIEARDAAAAPAAKTKK